VQVLEQSSQPSRKDNQKTKMKPKHVSKLERELRELVLSDRLTLKEEVGQKRDIQARAQRCGFEPMTMTFVLAEERRLTDQVFHCGKTWQWLEHEKQKLWARYFSRETDHESD
jgi:hypothetical protein